MNYLELRNNHNRMIDQLAIVELFISENYVRGERATLLKLSRKLHTSMEKTIPLIKMWCEYRRHNGEEQIQKLCIFFTTTHARPKWFVDLNLVQRDSQAVVQASRRMGLPTLSHIGTLGKLVSETPGGLEDAARQIMDCRSRVLSELFNHGWIPDGSRFESDVLPNDLVYPNRGYGGGAGNHRGRQVTHHFGNITVTHNWGYLTFDKLDRLLVNPNTADDFVILRDKSAESDDPIKRREVQGHLREFIKSMIAKGMLFADATEKMIRNHGTEKWEHRPCLVFTNKNELGVVVTVTWNEYAGLGKVVLDK